MTAADFTMKMFGNLREVTFWWNETQKTRLKLKCKCFFGKKQNRSLRENALWLSRRKNKENFASKKPDFTIQSNFQLDEEKSLAFQLFEEKYQYYWVMSGAPFYKKPSTQKSNFEWPPKKVNNLKISRQEPAEQERTFLNAKNQV